MSERVVYFNGQYVSELEARVSIFDSALMFGDMAFEMTRTFNHQPFRMRAHLERLYGSLRLLEIDCGLSIDEMEAISEETLAKNASTEADDVDWQIMHDVSRGPMPVYQSVFPDEIRPTVSINCWPLITHMGKFAHHYESGVDIIIPAQQALPAHLIDPKAKTRSRMHYMMAQLQAQRMGGGQWPVMLDPDGFIAEGPGWNIFLVKDGVLYTSEPRNCLLGVSRGVVLQLAAQLGIPLRETNLGRYEALCADEMFCTATTYSLVHAVSFEGQTVGDGQPGPIFRKITKAWQEMVGVDFVAQAHSYAERVDMWEQQASSVTV